eukprot:GHVO01051104.1.p1 GENE.GHVO01051104.1~~GHVO01051104.1.p1  ORF type:complete len:274 (+),score=58.05 GHVO01051104.1:40-822(+)
MTRIIRDMHQYTGAPEATVMLWDTLYRAHARSIFKNDSPYHNRQYGMLTDFLGHAPHDNLGHPIITPPWRTDGRCGPSVPDVHGNPGKCPPKSCCSPSGWCGTSANYCRCMGCTVSQPVSNTTYWDTIDTFKGVQSPHIGYPSLLPFALGIHTAPSVDAQELYKGVMGGGMLGAFGVRSLSSADKLYRGGEDYWRGSVWMNVNYLIARMLPSISSRLVNTCINASSSSYPVLYESYDDQSGDGKGVYPFTGWTACVFLLG